MKVALVICVTVFVTALSVAGLATLTQWWSRRSSPVPMAEVDNVEEENEPAAAEALELIEDAAILDPRFGRVWEDCVRKAADQLTAQIAGQHMAGRHCGSLEWNAEVPRPPDVAHDVAKAAFSYAVRTETTRRVNAMTGPGAFG